MEYLDIGDVSARSGVKPSGLRYYEAVGLIASVSRHGLRRQFLPDVLQQLKLIAWAQAAGFSLGEIAGMFGRDGRLALPRSELRQKADAIECQIRELTALRNTLRHVADCTAPSHSECATFRRLVDVAGARATPRKNAPKRPPIPSPRG